MASTSSCTGPVALDLADFRSKHDAELNKINMYRRAADFIAATAIYLKDNCLLRQPLQAEHIKERLLGHWGTCPGINLVYAHTNWLIRKYDVDMLLVTGPGHGAPANLANLYIEGALHHFYPELGHNEQGISTLVKGFSTPSGFPSHVNPEVPGTIHEGGELGYALAVAFGAVMDKPNLIATCIVGDGEAETGPTATAWHSIKFLDPKESGAVIPVVHVNNYKISSQTIYGSMSNEELNDLFRGYGYQVRFVENLHDLDADMGASMEWAYQEIRKIQTAAREGQRIFKPRWPVIIMRTPKGMGGIKELDGKAIEGSFRSHQVPGIDARNNAKSLHALEAWFRSYKPEELFDEHGTIISTIRETCPQGAKRLGVNPVCFPKFVGLNMPSIFDTTYAVTVDDNNPGRVAKSNTTQGGIFLREVVRNNPHRFRIVSPDELESNKLSGALDITTRNFQWNNANDAAKGGRILEILSEHTCQGWMQGYVLTGRFCVFPSYEAFLGIIATMMAQWSKFVKVSREVVWRNPVPSLNYIETSTLWRQEHNGFSHQNPGFINSIINLKSEMLRVYLPADANTFISTLDHCLKSKNYVNLIITSKHPTPQFLSMEKAVKHCRAGASIWHWCSTDRGLNPDVVFVGIGTEMTMEVVAAAILLQREVPSLRVRVVNINDFMILDSDRLHPHGLDTVMFNSLFTADKPVIINFHGYPSAVKQLLFSRENTARFTINGYQEEGTTTTPFKMLVLNGTSRFNLAMQAIRLTAKANVEVGLAAADALVRFQYMLKKHDEYAHRTGCDPDCLNDIFGQINIDE